MSCECMHAQVDQVWQQYTAGNCGVVVCHIDSGTHWNANNWYNAGEYGGIPLVDDDGNGGRTAFWHLFQRAQLLHDICIRCLEPLSHQSLH